MPPALSDDEQSISEDEIAPKTVKSVAQNGAEEDDEDDEEGDEDDDDDDLFIVETIKKHGFDPNDNLIFYVKWKDYPNSQNTWEPEDNLLGSADDALQEYYAKIGGRPTKQDKRKKKRKVDDDSTPQSGKVRRGKKAKTEDSDDEEELASKKKLKRDWEPPKGSWEGDLNSIDSIEEHPDEKTGEITRFVYVVWNNGKQSRHGLDVIRHKAPQKMLDFLIQHLHFKSADALPAASNGKPKDAALMEIDQEAILQEDAAED